MGIADATAGWEDGWWQLWKDGWSIVLPVYAGCAVLSLVLPGKIVDGYACDRTGKPLRYKLNGLRVLGVVVAAWMFGSSSYLSSSSSSSSSSSRYWKATTIADAFWGCLWVSFALGVLGSIVLVRSGSNRAEPYSRCATADRGRPPIASRRDLAAWESRSLWGHLFFGTEFNPRVAGGLDAKMYLYVAGATCLALNVLSAAALQVEIEIERDRSGEAMGEGPTSLASLSSRAMRVYVWMMGWFLLDYLWFEELHLYTYDLFAEKLGFKLVWGCLCFYPFFYSIGAWSIVGHDPASDLGSAQTAGILVLFYCGWTLTRGSNLQKFWFKRELERRRRDRTTRKKTDGDGDNDNDNDETEPPMPSCFWGLVPQVPIRPGSKICRSGFWGLARHVNYLGETLQALALAFPGYIASGGSWIPFLYPLYYVALFVPRSTDDGVLCATKYGPDWDEYVASVPYKIVPWIY